MPGEKVPPNGNELTPFHAATEDELVAAMFGGAIAFSGTLMKDNVFGAMVTYQQTDNVPSIQIRPPDHHLALDLGVDIFGGALLAVGLCVAVRYAAHVRRTGRLIRAAVRGLEQEHEAGLYLPWRPPSSQ